MISPASARVAHSMPGRLRLRVDRRAVDPEALTPVLARLRERPGVRSARYNPSSGSVVVEYDPGAVAAGTLLGELPVTEDASGDQSVELAGSSPAARSLAVGWWEADAALARATGGRIDLKLLVPLTLLLVALRQFVVMGELGAAPWHALLWYSYNVFYQFHPELREPERVFRSPGSGRASA